MKKLFIMICLGVLCFKPAHGTVDILSDANMENWANVIIYSVIDDMDFLALTKPVFLEKHLSILKYKADDPNVDKTDVEAAMIEISPKQTYEQLAGDCEDLTIYTIARMLQAKHYDVGFIFFRNPKKNTQGSQHIATVLLTEAGEVMVYDLTQTYEDMKRLPLDQYLLYWNIVAPDFDKYRIWWFFSPLSMQEKAESIK